MKQFFAKAATALFFSAGAFPALAQTQLPATWLLKAHASNSDQVTAIWTNPSGDSYVTGHSNIVPAGANAAEMAVMTIKVNTQGQEVWRRIIMPPAANQLFPKGITGDPSGNVYVLYNQRFQYTDSTINRLVVRKYDAAGNTLWSNTLTNYANGLVEDAAAREFRYRDGYLYACGSTFNGASNPLDGFLYKIDAANGTAVWRAQYNSSFNTDDAFRSYSIDATGNAWAVGRSRGYAGPGGIYSDYDAVVVHFNPAGVQQWDYRLNGSGNSDDFGLAVVADAAGNAYLSGQTDVLGSNSDSVVVEKISAAGQRQWRYGFIGSNTGHNYKQPILLQPNGNLVATATTAGGIRTFSVNPANGQPIWTALYNRDNQGAGDHPMDMVLDTDGNIYLAATTRMGSAVLSDVTTIKYSSTGTLEWFDYYTEPHIGSQEEGVSLALDGSNNVYTIGWVQDAQHNNDYFVTKHGDAPVVSGAAGLLSAQALSVYPNPARHVLYVSVAGKPGEIQVQLFTLAGQLVYSTTATATEARIPVHALPAGTYLLHCSNANKEVGVRKVVIGL